LSHAGPGGYSWRYKGGYFQGQSVCRLLIDTFLVDYFPRKIDKEKQVDPQLREYFVVQIRFYKLRIAVPDEPVTFIPSRIVSNLRVQLGYVIGKTAQSPLHILFYFSAFEIYVTFEKNQTGGGQQKKYQDRVTDSDNDQWLFQNCLLCESKIHNTAN
jgi:hypothetical protein